MSAIVLPPHAIALPGGGWGLGRYDGRPWKLPVHPRSRSPHQSVSLRIRANVERAIADLDDLRVAKRALRGRRRVEGNREAICLVDDMAAESRRFLSELVWC